jgi:hypothetical protein
MKSMILWIYVPQEGEDVIKFRKKSAANRSTKNIISDYRSLRCSALSHGSDLHPHCHSPVKSSASTPPIQTSIKKNQFLFILPSFVFRGRTIINQISKLNQWSQCKIPLDTIQCTLPPKIKDLPTEHKITSILKKCHTNIIILHSTANLYQFYNRN